MTAYGGYSEYMYLQPKQLIPVPDGTDPVRAAPLILNYIVAYHCLHRVAQVQLGQTALLIGASGGIGSAFLQLGRLVGLNMYALASPDKHDLLERYHAFPIDYNREDYRAVIRAQVPEGLDWVFDGVGGAYIRGGFSLLRAGGKLVSYANPFSMRRLVTQLGGVLLLGLLPNGRSTAYYSTGRSYFNRQLFLDDWATLFELLNTGRIEPVIAGTYPLEEASAADAALESGKIAGNLVLDLT
jgi:NADPH:quinone reductase-like Zn-dependent oxidoreductase